MSLYLGNQLIPNVKLIEKAKDDSNNNLGDGILPIGASFCKITPIYDVTGGSVGFEFIGNCNYQFAVVNV